MTQENEKVFEILRKSLWNTEHSVINEEITEAIREELRAQTVESLTVVTYPDRMLKMRQTAQFVKMVTAQRDALELLQNAHIPVVVLKGTASGMYYPIPCLRTYGDIDLLVQPNNYQSVILLMIKNGYNQVGDIGQYHTAFYKESFLFELHQSPPGLRNVSEGDYILKYILSGFFDIQTVVIDQPFCCFPVLPWKQNGLELIWHFREHLYNGIGLRHVIDWMMFVHSCLDDNAFVEYKEVLEKAGLLFLARVVTKMCQMYLGLEKSITWCSVADDTVCASLMAFIMEQGDFGKKKMDDKAAKVLTRYRTPVSILRRMQKKGEKNWTIVKKYPFLRSFSWIYFGVKEIKKCITNGGWKQLKANIDESRKRSRFFDQLYGPRLQHHRISKFNVCDNLLEQKKDE